MSFRLLQKWSSLHSVAIFEFLIPHLNYWRVASIFPTSVLAAPHWINFLEM